MPATTQSLQSPPHRAPAYYQGRPASWQITALRRTSRQLVFGLTRRAQRLRERRRAGYRLEPMPRMRWY